jgi:hypothetical protein
MVYDVVVVKLSELTATRLCIGCAKLIFFDQYLKNELARLLLSECSFDGGLS